MNSTNFKLIFEEYDLLADEELLNQYLLEEGRLEDAKAQANHLSPEQFEILRSNDPTAANTQSPYKYLGWMVKASKTPEDKLPQFFKERLAASKEDFLESIADLTQAFHDNLTLVPQDKKDIARFDVNSLFNFISPLMKYKDTISNRTNTADRSIKKIDFSQDIFNGGYTVYEDDTWILYRVMSIQKSCNVGRQYKLSWCLTGAGGGKYDPESAKYYYNSYLNEKNNMYFLEFKTNNNVDPQKFFSRINAIIHDPDTGNFVSLHNSSNSTIYENEMKSNIIDGYTASGKDSSNSRLLALKDLINQNDKYKLLPTYLQEKRINSYIYTQINSPTELDEYINLCRNFFTKEEMKNIAIPIKKQYDEDKKGKMSDLANAFIDTFSVGSLGFELTAENLEKLRRGFIDEGMIRNLISAYESADNGDMPLEKFIKYIAIYYEGMNPQKYQNVLYLFNKIDPLSDYIKTQIFAFLMLSPILELKFKYLSNNPTYDTMNGRSFGAVMGVRDDFAKILTTSISKPIYVNLRKIIANNSEEFKPYFLKIHSGITNDSGLLSINNTDGFETHFGIQDVWDTTAAIDKLSYESFKMHTMLLDSFLNVPKTDISIEEFKHIEGEINGFLHYITYGFNQIGYIPTPSITAIKGTMSAEDQVRQMKFEDITDPQLKAFIAETLNKDTFSKMLYKASGDYDALKKYVEAQTLQDGSATMINNLRPVMEYIFKFIVNNKARNLISLDFKDPKKLQDAIKETKTTIENTSYMAMHNVSPASMLQYAGRSEYLRSGVADLSSLSTSLNMGEDFLEKSMLYSVYHYLIYSKQTILTLSNEFEKRKETIARDSADGYNTDLKQSIMIKLLNSSENFDDLIKNIQSSAAENNLESIVPDFRGLKLYYYNSMVHFTEQGNIVQYFTTYINPFQEMYKLLVIYLENLFYVKNFLVSLQKKELANKDMIFDYLDKNFSNIVFGDTTLAERSKQDYLNSRDIKVLTEDPESVKIIQLCIDKYNEELKEIRPLVEEITNFLEERNEKFVSLYKSCSNFIIKNNANLDNESNPMLQKILEIFKQMLEDRDIPEDVKMHIEGRIDWDKFKPKSLSKVKFVSIISNSFAAIKQFKKFIQEAKQKYGENDIQFINIEKAITPIIKKIVYYIDILEVLALVNRMHSFGKIHQMREEKAAEDFAQAGWGSNFKYFPVQMVDENEGYYMADAKEPNLYNFTINSAKSNPLYVHDTPTFEIDSRVALYIPQAQRSTGFSINLNGLTAEQVKNIFNYTIQDI